MLRLLGIGLVGVLVLASGPGAREPLTKEEYIAVVRSVSGDVDDRFDDVVNYTYYPCHRICSRDENTLTGKGWLGSERLLRRDIDAITTRLRAFRPPHDVALLHARWMMALNRCSESLRSLEADQRRYASSDSGVVVRPSAEGFEMEVAQRLKPACFDRFNQIIPAFEAHGYEFTPAS